jgi:hypothetical protein
MISFLSRTIDFFFLFLSLWIYLWLAETSQQPISQTTWLKVTPNCNHCNHCNHWGWMVRARLAHLMPVCCRFISDKMAAAWQRVISYHLSFGRLLSSSLTPSCVPSRREVLSLYALVGCCIDPSYCHITLSYSIPLVLTFWRYFPFFFLVLIYRCSSIWSPSKTGLNPDT